MAGFNSDAYLENQVKKQYRETRKSMFKHPIKRDEIARLLEDYKDLNLVEVHNKLKEMNIEEIQESVKNNALSYDVIVAAYLNDIIFKNDDYNCLIYLNMNALKVAKSLKYSDNNHPIFGMPVLVKANIGVKDMPLTAGSYALKDLVPKIDSPVIANVKKYGGIVLGLTNLSEFANYMTSDSSNGYSTLGGQTKNPYGAFDVGGSSSGSAASVALNFSPVAIGTETAGSIIYPASQNAVIGLKPSQGLISKCSIVPISSTYDTAGPMGKDPKDVLLLLEVMSDQLMNAFKVTKMDLKEFKIAVVNNEELKSIYRKDDETLLSNFVKNLSQHVSQVDYIEMKQDLFSLEIGEVLKGQFKNDLNDFFHKQNSKLTLNKVIEKNNAFLNDLCPYGQDLLIDANESEFSKKYIAEIIDKNKTISTEALMDVFKSYDLILTISNYMTVSYTCSGFPAINFPVSKRTTGEPFGVTFIGEMNQDEKLLRVVDLIKNII